MQQQLYSSLLQSDAADIGPLQIVVEDATTDDDQLGRDDVEDAGQCVPPADQLDNEPMDTAACPSTSATEPPALPAADVPPVSRLTCFICTVNLPDSVTLGGAYEGDRDSPGSLLGNVICCNNNDNVRLFD